MAEKCAVCLGRGKVLVTGALWYGAYKRCEECGGFGVLPMNYGSLRARANDLEAALRDVVLAWAAGNIHRVGTAVADAQRLLDRLTN